MKTNRIINLNVFHFEIKNDKIVFFGNRGDPDTRYEIHISFEDPQYFFARIGQECVRYLESKAIEIIGLINTIKNG